VDIDAYCLSKLKATKDYQPDWEATRYMIGGKIFAMVGCDKQGKPIISLKSDPVDALALREQFSGIIPGYYLNKKYWNSVYLEDCPPDEVVLKMIDISYELVFNSFSKKKQNEMKGV